jgi:hypothetical protein
VKLSHKGPVKLSAFDHALKQPALPEVFSPLIYIFYHLCCVLQMALITQNFHSPLIRDHYYDRRQLAVHFLVTTGAKALVLEDQKSHELSLYDGIHEEAELRYQIVTLEKIRSIKRKLLEKQSIKLMKCSRKGKYRAIDVILEHSRKDETNIIWLSKYNYVKRFFVDKHTQITLLEKPKNYSLAQVIDISSLSCSPPQEYCASPGKSTQQNSPNSPSKQHHEILPIRLKNHHRYLDVFFYNLYDLEAFILTLHRFSSVNYSNLKHLFYNDM